MNTEKIKEELIFFNTMFQQKDENKSRAELLMNKIFIEAIEADVSDIHIEPYKDYFRIRYRIDGILLEKSRGKLNELFSLLSIIKILCNLDITEKRLPQDGRVNGKYKNKELDFRISIIPTYFGEKIVIRILYKEISKKSLKELGIDTNNYKKLYDIIQRKSGMLIIAGPMGSGKTTTMYGIINELNNNEKNIVTIEDPIEYVVDGINQVQCKDDIGLDFIRVLKAILRQDVDILMIGEIRDSKTAEIAIKASLTGHMILTTLHTKDTKDAIKRLINLGIEPYMIASGLKGVLSQRLVRKLCDNCKEEDKNYNEKFRILALENIKPNKKIYMKKGCEQCNHTGYKGRILVGEFMYIDSNIANIISNSIEKNNLTTSLKNLGVKSLIENGMELVYDGLTSLDELIREC